MARWVQGFTVQGMARWVQGFTVQGMARWVQGLVRWVQGVPIAMVAMLNMLCRE